MENNDRVQHLISFSVTAAALVGYQLTICLPSAICSIFIGRLGDEISLGAFGIAATIINISFSGIVMGVQEALGVVTAKLYGSGKTNEMSGYFYKSIMISLVISVLFHILSHYSYGLLLAIGIEDDVAYPSYQLLKKCAYYLYFQGINGVINNFLSAQQITKPLYILNVASIFSIYIFANLFIERLGFREIGFAYTKLCQEILNFLFYVIVLLNNVDRKIFKPISKFELFDKIGYFLKFNFFTSLSFYGEFLSFEINTYYAALLHDPIALATWVTFINYTSLYYFASIGFANAVRNFIGRKVGEYNIDQAKADSKLYFTFIGAISVVFMVLQVIFRDVVARIYTTNSTIIIHLKSNLVLYVLNIYPTFTLLAFNTIYRILGQDKLQLRMNVIVFPSLILVISYLLCFAFGFKVEGLNLSFSLCKAFVISVMAYWLYNTIEWRSAGKDEILDDTLENELMSSFLEPEVAKKKGFY